MRSSKSRLLLSLAALITCLAMPVSAGAADITQTASADIPGAIVKVTLADQGADAEMATDLGLAIGGADKAKATMSIKISPAVVRAGNVTFEVANGSTDTIHEMIVAPVADTSRPLPYIAAESRVDEDAATHLGEVSELDPGKAGALKLDLKPGKYILFCNIPGHYMNGMWTLLTVE
jgi:uncharacterized cupredoxin-like copper-binding protein